MVDEITKRGKRRRSRRRQARQVCAVEESRAFQGLAVSRIGCVHRGKKMVRSLSASPQGYAIETPEGLLLVLGVARAGHLGRARPEALPETRDGALALMTNAERQRLFIPRHPKALPRDQYGVNWGEELNPALGAKGEVRGWCYAAHDNFGAFMSRWCVTPDEGFLEGQWNLWTTEGTPDKPIEWNYSHTLKRFRPAR